MNTDRLRTISTFAASVAVGCGAALAIASVAAVSQAAPSLRHAPAEVVRLEPVVVNVSKATFDAVRAETAVARASDVRKTARG